MTSNVAIDELFDRIEEQATRQDNELRAPEILKLKASDPSIRGEGVKTLLSAARYLSGFPLSKIQTV